MARKCKSPGKESGREGARLSGAALGPDSRAGTRITILVCESFC